MKTFVLFKYLIFTLSFCLICLNAFSETIYVNESANNGGDGSSWNDAFKNLDAALDVANAGDEIWVAAGTYKLDDNTESYNLVNGVAIYGGFSGAETAVEQRDFESNPTIFSGDIEGNDEIGNFITNRVDNNIHVFFADIEIDNSTILDGLIITGGNTVDSFGSGNDQRGGGILSEGSPIISNCTFTDNFGYNGGGICLRTPTAQNAQIENCKFIGNHCQSRGAGLYIDDPAIVASIENCLFEENFSENSGAAVGILSASPSFTSCQFIDNESFDEGGAIFVNAFVGDGNLNFDDCEFMGNTSMATGGAMHTLGETNIHFDGCIFESNGTSLNGGALFADAGITNFNNCTLSGNIGQVGGAIYSKSDSLTVTGSTFESNTASEQGAGIYVQSSTVFVTDNHFNGNTSFDGGGLYLDQCIAQVKNCFFVENMASNRGGGIYATEIETVVSNCVFEANSSTSGGGINSTDNNQMVIVHSTFYGNEVVSLGPAIGSFFDAYLIIVNSILYGNEGSQDSPIGYITPLPPDVRHSIVESGFEGEQVINTNPAFVNPDSSDFHITIISPALNSGTNNFQNIPEYDIEGTERDTFPDMGAFEFPYLAPDQPSELVAEVNSASSILLTWLDNASNEDNYIVERSITTPDNYFEIVDNLPPNTTSYEDQGLVSGTTYFYRVTAITDGIKSLPSNDAAAFLPVNPPSAPSDLQATDTTDTTISVSWIDNSDDEEGFVLERIFGSTIVMLDDIPANATSYIDDNLLPNTTYLYRVKSTNQNGFSENSNTIEVTTKPDGTGLEDLPINYKVYPNPFNGQIFIDLPEALQPQNTIQLLTIDGKLILEQSPNGNKTIQLNVNDLPNGEYFLIIKDKGIKKLLKL